MRYIFLIFLIVIIETNVEAQEYMSKFYIKGNVGIGVPANKFKEKDDAQYIDKKPNKSAAYNVGIGYIINDNWRSDLNFNYRNLKYKAEEENIGFATKISQKVKIYSIFFNGYYDVNIHKKIKPYFTAGAGYSRTASNTATFSMDGELMDTFPGKKTNNFAWNVGAGLRLVLNDRLSFDVYYAYVNLGKTKVENGEDDPTILGASQKITSHDIMGGVLIHL